MPRIVVVKNETDMNSLRSKLMNARLSEAQAKSAAASFEDLNPHLADAKNIAPGTVVLVPDTPGFKGSASEPVSGGAAADFQKLIRGGLVSAATRMKSANADRAAERLDVVNAQKTAIVKKAMEADPQLKQQLDDAAKNAKAAQQEATQAEKAMDAMVDGAQSELDAITKLLG